MRRRRAPHDPTSVVLIAVTALAATIAYVYAVHAGFSSVNDIDGPTYFAGAVQLVHGRLPYRDFIFVQPPGVLLLASPFALASRLFGTGDAFAAVRVFMPLVGTANVALVGWRVRHRGPLAVLVGAGGLAVYVPAILTTRTLLLEPWLDLFCLLALNVAFDDEGSIATPRRVGLAGVLLGFAVAVKLWALLPLVLLGLWCMVSAARSSAARSSSARSSSARSSSARSSLSRRRFGLLGLGAAVGFGLPSVPFFVLAPGQCWHDIVVSQLSRFGLRIPFAARMSEVLGITRLHLHSVSTTTILVAFLLVAVFLVATARALVVLRRRPTALAMFSLVSTAAVFGTIMLPGEFPYHYVDFLAPFAFVTLGLGAGTIAERLIAARATVLAFSSLAILAVAAVLALDIPVLSPPIANNFGAIVDQYVPPGSCVVTDFIGFTIAANRYVNRQPGCPVIVDPFGLDLALDNGRTPPDRGRPTAAVVAAWHSAFAHTDWVVLTRTFHTRIFFVRSVRRYFYRNFTALSSPYFKVFERTSLLKAARRST